MVVRSPQHKELFQLATNNNTQELSTITEGALVLVDTLDHLKEAFAKAHNDYDHAEGIRAQAAHNKSVAAVWMSRIAYRTMTHPDVASKRYPENITGAAKVLGMPVGTLRPYGLAGIALAKKDLAGLLSEPEPADLAIVEASFDATTRADQKAKRVKEAQKKAALEAKAKELDALKAKTPAAPAGVADVQAAADAVIAAGQADKVGTAPTAPTAPGTAPAPAPAPSVTDDILRTARELVKMSKAQRANDKGAWAKTHGELVKILADLFPGIRV
jgi:hypothetical protein